MVIKHCQGQPEPGRAVFTKAGVMRGARRLVFVALVTVPYGIAFGAAAVAADVGSADAIAMSAMIFSGVVQFATLEQLASPSSPAVFLLLVIALNARNVLMGASLASIFNRLPWKQRLPTLWVFCDPVFADAQSPTGKADKDAGVLFGAGLVVLAGWVGGTAIGVIGGQALGDLSRFGFDVALIAFFAAIAAGQANARDHRLPMIVAAVSVVVLATILPRGWDIVIAAVIGGGIHVLRDR